MEAARSKPVNWVGEEHLGFVVNTVFSPENATLITDWLRGLVRQVPEGLYTMSPEGLHITVLDWVSPLPDYHGADKRAMYEDLRKTCLPALRAITDRMRAFDVHFTSLKVTPETVLLVGQDHGQFQSLRDRFTSAVQLPAGGKQPPSIIHSSLARFVTPEIELSTVEAYAAERPLILTQRVSEFRLVETRREPMQDSTVLDRFQLAS